MSKVEKMTILIPSLEPDEKLVPYIKTLLAKGFSDILVIDDGSGEKYAQVFQEIDQLKGCHVLHHHQNKGKGCALKTGYAYLEERGNCDGVITVDSDGQHTLQDVWKIAEEMAKGEKALFLGSRDFTLGHVPWKSRFGNQITSSVFWALYGAKLPDTQTGLRGFSATLLSFMKNVKGERFEYEMNVLIDCVGEGIPMIPVTIETVYENENEGSHFRAFRDSMKIYKVIVGNFFLFAGSSILSFLIDVGLFTLFNYWFGKAYGMNQVLCIALATVLARVISSVFNFFMNKNVVFKKEDQKQGGVQTFTRYALLAIGIVAVSAIGVSLLAVIGVPNTLGKVVVDTLLYFISYRVQKKWVFNHKKAQ
ncbi:MAG: glycosyltransferase [Clostridiales bacterium]|nr:glycosyltransferase [Clostridiales bacterium]